MRENTGTAWGVAIVAVAFLATLPFVLAAMIWLVVCVYAMIKLFGSAPDGPNGEALVITVVMVVTALTLALAGTLHLVGRSMTPAKRREREAEQLMFDDR
jgi:hypothetical protein